MRRVKGTFIESIRWGNSRRKTEAANRELMARKVTVDGKEDVGKDGDEEEKIEEEEEECLIPPLQGLHNQRPGRGVC
jgi:hypothetical protein